MNFDDYKTTLIGLYAEFAETVRFILDRGIRANAQIPKPQSIQHRAKSPESLRRRLQEAGNLHTTALEDERRDLAGVRLIFYTNNDVERFFKSGVIAENFEIEHEGVKIHHPTEDNAGKNYRARHYTIRLRDDRTKLPEYARFAGMRCEIQVQTILNHAWSETSHDILYKGDAPKGFGTKAREGLTKRFNVIMEKYLAPAGYEMQKAQDEYERLRQGKELFDSDVFKLLTEARDNNERYQILTGVRDYTIWNFDDVQAAYKQLRAPLLAVARAARAAPVVPIETIYGQMAGHSAKDVLKVVIEILSQLRYQDNVEETFSVLAELFAEEIDPDIRKEITEAVKHLAEYELHVWKQVGPQVQLALVQYLATLSQGELTKIPPLAITVWQEALNSDIRGATWKTDSVTLHAGALPVSDMLREIRTKAIDGLFETFLAIEDPVERAAITNALDAATRTPTQANYSNDLLKLTLVDAKRITDFYTQHSKTMRFEMLQSLEHRLLYDYRRAESLAVDAEQRFGVQAEAGALIAAVEGFRDTINQDENFVRYKILVGFESVYPQHWTDDDFDYNGAEVFRKQEADKFIGAIDDDNKAEWLEFIERCASTKSNDLATFPVFGQFIVDLSTQKPEIADYLLNHASPDLLGFLPAFLRGLSQSARKDIYNRNIEAQLASGKNLSAIARHLRNDEISNPPLAGQILAKALASNDEGTISEMLILVMESWGTGRVENEDVLFKDAIRHLNQQRNARWIWEAWFQLKTNSFLTSISRENAELLLDNLTFQLKVDYRQERVLEQIAVAHLDLVWEYFGKRLSHEKLDGEGRYEAIPFEFHGLQKVLAQDAALAVENGRAWFAKDNKLFRFNGGRMLKNAFPDCSADFANALAELVTSGQDADTDFVLDIMQNYHGEAAIHEVLKRVVTRFPSDERKLSKVKISLDSTGVVGGEFGMVDALREKKVAIEAWLTDIRPEVKAFAEAHIKELDQSIAWEQQRAEQDRELRNRDFPEDEENDGLDGEK